MLIRTNEVTYTITGDAKTVHTRTPAQPIAEPYRKNYAVLRKVKCKPENPEAGRLAHPLGGLIASSDKKEKR